MTPAVLNDIDAATYLGITPYWLRNKRYTPQAPPFVKIGGRIKYRIATLDTWLEQQEVVN